MSANFCTNLIDSFNEFIRFKVNYFDPLVINSGFLLNCYNGTDTTYLKLDYKVLLNEINECINKGGIRRSCQKVCEEFKIGQTSDLFIGNLQNYIDLMKDLDKMMS